MTTPKRRAAKPPKKEPKWNLGVFTNITDVYGGGDYYTNSNEVWLNFGGDGIYQFNVKSNRGIEFEREVASVVADTFTRVTTLFDAIQHGEPKHKAWLKQAIIDHFEGRPVKREKP